MPELKQLGRYIIEADLGSGAFADVYKALDKTLKRQVALKVLKPRLVADEEAFMRFVQEAQVGANLFHPHIATVLDLGEVDGYYYLAMRYVEGRSLDKLLKETGALPWERVRNFVQQVGEALDFAHVQGLIHRDVKPSNILIDDHDKAVLTDFGLVRALASSGMTDTGILMGTPNYMAPEIWLGKEITASVDLYSLACVVVEMLTGKKLFEGDSAPVVMTRHVLEGAKFPENWPDGVPEGINTVLARALAKQPEERYASIEEFQDALSGLSQEKQSIKSEEVKEEPEVDVPSEDVEEEDQPKESDVPVLEGTGTTKELVTQPVGNQPEQEQGESKDKVEEPPQINKGKTSNSSTSPTWSAWVLLGLLGIVVLVIYFGPSIRGATPPSTPITILDIGSTRTREKDGMKVVYVPAGTFLMGASDEQVDWILNQSWCSSCDKSLFESGQPIHEVYLDAYWIDKFEVTNGQYAQCVAEGACEAPSSSEAWQHSVYYDNIQFADYPVIFVNWYQAQSYCQWAGGRLPSEAEWEKAARGTDARYYPWGNEAPTDQLINRNALGPAKVGSFPEGASPYGAMDMAGNVWEWVADWHDDGYYSISPTNNPTGSGNGESRGVRGGGWSEYDINYLTSARSANYPDGTSEFGGFRCITPEQP